MVLTVVVRGGFHSAQQFYLDGRYAQTELSSTTAVRERMPAGVKLRGGGELDMRLAGWPACMHARQGVK